MFKYHIAFSELNTLCTDVLHSDIAVRTVYFSDLHAILLLLLRNTMKGILHNCESVDSVKRTLFLTDTAAYALSMVNNCMAVSH